MKKGSRGDHLIVKYVSPLKLLEKKQRGNSRGMQIPVRESSSTPLEEPNVASHQFLILAGE